MSEPSRSVLPAGRDVRGRGNRRGRALTDADTGIAATGGDMPEPGSEAPGGTALRRPREHRPPTPATVKELYATALRCGKPGCLQSLYRVSEDTGERVLNSDVAHMHARREGGPRWAPAMTEDA